MNFSDADADGLQNYFHVHQTELRIILRCKVKSKCLFNIHYGVIYFHLFIMAV